MTVADEMRARLLEAANAVAVALEARRPPRTADVRQLFECALGLDLVLTDGSSDLPAAWLRAEPEPPPVAPAAPIIPLQVLEPEAPPPRRIAARRRRELPGTLWCSTRCHDVAIGRADGDCRRGKVHIERPRSSDA